MPVLISAFQRDLPLVRLLAKRLLADGGEVRAYLEEDDHELRQMGCKLAVGILHDDLNLEAALTNVHTFMPLVSEPDGPGLEVEAFARAASGAAGEVKVPQVILAILAKGDSPRGDGPVEDHFRSRCSPLCIVRVPPGVDPTGLADLLAAIDDREEVEGEFDWDSARATFMPPGSR